MTEAHSDIKNSNDIKDDDNIEDLGNNLNTSYGDPLSMKSAEIYARDYMFLHDMGLPLTIVHYIMTFIVREVSEDTKERKSLAFYQNGISDGPLKIHIKKTITQMPFGCVRAGECDLRLYLCPSDPCIATSKWHNGKLLGEWVERYPNNEMVVEKLQGESHSHKLRFDTGGLIELEEIVDYCMIYRCVIWKNGIVLGFYISGKCFIPKSHLDNNLNTENGLNTDPYKDFRDKIFRYSDDKNKSSYDIMSHKKALKILNRMRFDEKMKHFEPTCGICHYMKKVYNGKNIISLNDKIPATKKKKRKGHRGGKNKSAKSMINKNP